MGNSRLREVELLAQPHTATNGQSQNHCCCGPVPSLPPSFLPATLGSLNPGPQHRSLVLRDDARMGSKSYLEAWPPWGL